MSGMERFDAGALRSAGAIEMLLHENLVDWQVSPLTRAAPVVACIRPRSIGDIRFIDLQAGPFNGVRSVSEIANDGDEYLGVLFQRSGTTQCQMGDQRICVGPGDISLWHSERPAEFVMPDFFHKLCMLIPVSRFESVLHDPKSYEGLHLPATNPLARLIGSYLSTLSDDVAESHDPVSSRTVDVTLELLASAFRANQSKEDQSPRKKLLRRILQYIEARLGDADLTPASIASGNGISLRYLYLVFNEQGLTVARWIRVRRLARCRAELEDETNKNSITQIAYKWGFGDSANFSRLFKSEYGTPPAAYRANRRAN